MRAIVKPIPLDAPVTTMTCSRSGLCLLLACPFFLVEQSCALVTLVSLAHERPR
jgi:hypothetical protein